MRKRAFSLLEMVLAGTLFATTTLMMMGIWVTHNSAVGRSRMLMVGTYAAQQTLDTAVAKKFAGNVFGTYPSDITVKTTMRSIVQTAVFHSVLTVKPAGTLGNLKSLQVVVTWQDAPGHQRDIHMETIIYDGN